jgi:hypothetical protein
LACHGSQSNRVLPFTCRLKSSSVEILLLWFSCGRADYPDGKKGDVLTVEFTVLGIPCLGLNGGPAFRHTEGLFFPDRDGESGRGGPLLERDRRQWRHGKPVRLVQGPLGPFLAVHPARANRCACGWWRRGKACLRGDDDDEGRSTSPPSRQRGEADLNTPTPAGRLERRLLLEISAVSPMVQNRTMISITNVSNASFPLNH